MPFPDSWAVRLTVLHRTVPYGVRALRTVQPVHHHAPEAAVMTSTMKNAKQFVQRIRTDTTFRKVLYSFGSLDEISDFLEREGLFCSLDDFENTVSGMKLDAVDADQAEEIGEIERWWKLLLSALEPS